MDWARKHLSELVSVCRLCEADSTLSSSQQAAFAGIYELAGRFTSLPNAGGQRNVATTVVIQALFYQATNRTPGQPRREYMQGIVAAARRHGFDEAYIAELSLWMPE